TMWPATAVSCSFRRRTIRPGTWPSWPNRGQSPDVAGSSEATWTWTIAPAPFATSTGCSSSERIRDRRWPSRTRPDAGPRARAPGAPRQTGDSPRTWLVRRGAYVSLEQLGIRDVRTEYPDPYVS